MFSTLPLTIDVPPRCPAGQSILKSRPPPKANGRRSVEEDPSVVVASDAQPPMTSTRAARTRTFLTTHVRASHVGQVVVLAKRRVDNRQRLRARHIRHLSDTEQSPRLSLRDLHRARRGRTARRRLRKCR